MTTYKAIQHQEVGAGGAASITFSDIPQTYTDLVVMVSGRCATDNNFYLRFNNTTTTYSYRILRGTGSVANSASGSGIVCITGYSGRTANTFGNTAITIPNYTANTQKSVSADCVEENNATESYQTIVAGLWTSTDAITSIQLVGFGDWAQYSSATLYGVTRAALPTPTDVYSDSLLEEVVLTSSAASVTFSGLDAYAALGYTNLQIRAVARSTNTGGDYLNLRFNGNDTLSTYARHILVGEGSSVNSYASTGSTITNIGRIADSSDPTSTFGAHVIDVLDAFETSKYTTARSLGGSSGTNKEIDLNSILFMSTSAISSIKLQTYSGSNLAQYSRFSLYGSK